MSLDNIYYWNEDSWKKITAEEFVKKYPDIKISAKDKYFWCEMCGQYVTLANGDVNKPHFRHYSAELKKDCDDRANNFSKNDWIKSSQPSYDLPLKIYFEQNDFYFKVGLTRLPHSIFDEVKRCCIKIQAAEKILNRSDLSDYLIEGETTWLDVGGSPAKSYSLSLEPEISEVNLYWKKEIEGVSLYGTLFNVNTGRKILNDADIKVNSKYYLLTNQYIQSSKDVFVEKLFSKKIFRYNWILYKTLYNKGCKLSVNSIGVFNWQAMRDVTRYGSLYITSEYSFDKVPIEIFILESCIGINDLRNKLLNGLRIDFSTERVLIVYRSSDNIYNGPRNLDRKKAENKLGGR